MVSIVNKTATQNVSAANAHGRLGPVNYARVDLRDPHVSMKHLAMCAWCGFLMHSAVAVKRKSVHLITNLIVYPVILLDNTLRLLLEIIIFSYAFI